MERRLEGRSVSEPTPPRDDRDPSERVESEIISLEERRRRVRAPLAENLEPMRLAEAFRKTLYEMSGLPLLVRWARAWWRYDGQRFIELDDESLLREIFRFLDDVVVEKRDKEGNVRRDRVTATTKRVNELRQALVAVMPILADAPAWTVRYDHDPDPSQLMSCLNGMLEMKTRRLLPSTPRYFSSTSVGTTWDANAPEPREWLAFLRSIWGDDGESIRALQQLFGYLLTTDTRHQKIFAIVGPKRSGKSTIGEILTALVGQESVVAPTLASFDRPFGLQPLVGKSVAIIGDARLGGRADQQAVVERLLSISGEDAILVDRKNRDPINVRFRVRVVLLSNELPRLYDASGAIASRFVILQTTRSFYGEEDVDLKSRLLKELPSIFRWALDGYDDLREQGRFTVPLASMQAIEELEALSSPITVFLADRCELSPGFEIEKSDLYAEWKKWCELNGREPGNSASLGRDLLTAIPTLRQRHHQRPDGKRVRFYQGLRLAN
jgi:putative DNA primase/helicase